MCNYTAYLNVARALDRTKKLEDDLKFSEEIWANLQRAAEVGIKAAEAFEKVYNACAGRKLKLDVRQLQGAEEDIKKYRNRLHEPIPATIKDDTRNRLIPSRDCLDAYERWTNVMYHGNPADFVSVEGQLRSDLGMVCQALQSVWAQIRDHSGELLATPSFRTKLSAGARNPIHNASPANSIAASGTIVGEFGPQSLPARKQ